MKQNTVMKCLHFVLLSLPVTASFLPRFEQRSVLRPTPVREQSADEKQSSASESFDERWNTMFERLKEYKQQHGDCLVPSRYSEDPKLGIWVQGQRRAPPSIDDKKTKERRDKLDSIGFVWSTRPPFKSSKNDKKWNDMFERLKAYRQQHGDCLVPRHYADDPELGFWVSNQRQYRVRLDSSQQGRLESIGFVWMPRQKRWNDMFERLAAYRQQHGDCLVPLKYPDDPELGFWVNNQRQNCAKLDTTQHERLESIGFVWSTKNRDKWDDMFERLQAYRQQYGDCLVPHDYAEDPKLALWVRNQRQNRAKLDMARLERLDSIGFVWSVRNKWDDTFERLQ